jgi:hypothetical protein
MFFVYSHPRWNDVRRQAASDKKRKRSVIFNQVDPEQQLATQAGRKKEEEEAFFLCEIFYVLNWFFPPLQRSYLKRKKRWPALGQNKCFKEQQPWLKKRACNSKGLCEICPRHFFASFYAVFQIAGNVVSTLVCSVDQTVAARLLLHESGIFPRMRRQQQHKMAKGS